MKFVTIRPKRGSFLELGPMIPRAGEMLLNTDNNKYVIGDGVRNTDELPFLGVLPDRAFRIYTSPVPKFEEKQRGNDLCVWFKRSWRAWRRRS